MTRSANPDSSPPDRATAYRILDANLNRCLEGLRVVEEHLRFAVEDAHLAAACKQLRHDVVQAMSPVETGRLHAARDAARDVGATIRAEGEYERADSWAVATASWKRVEQALRSLEEYVKLVAPGVATPLESLRYRSYTLERAVTLLRSSGQRLADARLYVLLAGGDSREQFAQLARAVVTGGADVVQLRDKQLADRELLHRARLLRTITRAQNVLMIVNDRPDLALLAGADGVHLGQQELPVKGARQILGTDALIGVSTHCLDQARQAVLDGANYLGCGPTFPSTTKTFREFPGLEYLHAVAGEIQLPAFAIGGIDVANIREVCRAGFFRVAVSGAITNAADPSTAASTIRAALADAAPASRAADTKDDCNRL